MPPRNEEDVHHLHDTVAALRPLRPDFVSVTYPAISRAADARRRELTIELGPTRAE
jgi:5,10-methylenetetrahydrofolate reductase